MSHSVVGPEAGDEDTRPVTIYDIQAVEDSKGSRQALPRLTRQALQIAWALPINYSARCRPATRRYSGLSSKVGQICPSDSGNA
jgi:hypothetical protein